MEFNRFHIPVGPLIFVWFFGLIFLGITGILTLANLISPLWLILPGFILGIILFDSFQNKHSIRRNFPLLGRFRYFFESIRPELRQYFFEGELDGKPFNRRQRSIVYQRSKNVKQTVSFGMQDDPQRVGYEWVAHSIYPKVATTDSFRLEIGNDHCKQPYNASILNISAMSYGALSKTAITSLNMGAQKGGFAHNTGEGGISPYHLSGADLIWQIGTGYFGCRNDDGTFSDVLFKMEAQRPEVKMIELKLSQGAKPGHGGLLPAEKNSPEIASIRKIKPYTSVHSPSAHSAFTNDHELLNFIHKLKVLSQGKPVGIKLCVGREEEFIALIKQMQLTGIIPDFITVDGAEGGTGAAPLEFMDQMGMPLMDALIFVNNALIETGIRNQTKIIASGKIITAFDIAKHISLGADAIYMARGMMFALGCIQALLCDSGRCPVGIATQNKLYYKGIDPQDKSERVASFHKNTLKALADFIGACGFSNLSEVKPDVFHKLTNPGETKQLSALVHEMIHSKNKNIYNETSYQ